MLYLKEQNQIINIIPTLSNKSDGVGKFVRNYHNALMEHGINSKIFTLDSRNLKNTKNYYYFKKFFFLKKFGFSLSLYLWILKMSIKKNKAIYHLHGIWMWTNIFPILIPNLNYIYSPHGAISPYTIKKWSFFKKLYFSLIQKKVIEKAMYIHCSSRLEANWLKKLNFPIKKIKIIPLCDKANLIKKKKLKKFKDKNINFIFVGRIAKIKNLEIFFDQFLKVSSLYGNCKLTIVGDLNSDYSKFIYNKYSSKKINFVGFKDEVNVRKLLTISDYFILPSYTENFSYAALEACKAGCSLIVSKNTPWGHLTPSFVSFEFNPLKKSEIESILTTILSSKSKKLFKKKNYNELDKFNYNNFIIKLQSILKLK